MTRLVGDVVSYLRRSEVRWSKQGLSGDMRTAKFVIRASGISFNFHGRCSARSAHACKRVATSQDHCSILLSHLMKDLMY